jgi:hypothetical protein
LVELYGRDATLGRSTTGELLATLAVQISIAQENAELVKRLARRRAELQRCWRSCLRPRKKNAAALPMIFTMV